MKQPMIQGLTRGRDMKHVSETEDSLGGVILRIVDSIVTVVIMAVVVGIVLFTLFPRGSWGAISPLDLGAPTSVTTASQQVQGPERPTLETMGNEPINLNLGKKDAPRMQFRLEGIARKGGHGAENVIRTDETSVRLLAPWQ
jgi:hypothetical protein